MNCWERLRADETDWQISSEAEGKPTERSTTRSSSLKEIEELKTLPGQRAHQGRLNDKKWLTDRYITKQMSCAQIGKEIGCWEKTVSMALRRAGIRSRKSNKGRKFPEVGKRHSAWLMGRFTGSKNPNWRGDAVKNSKRERTGYQAKMWSLAVRTRDGFKCVECGMPRADGMLHAHHIKEWRRNKAARYDVANGITVCVPCHQRKHKNQFAAWLLVPKGKRSKSASRPL